MRLNLIKYLIFSFFALFFTACSSKFSEPIEPFLRLEFEQNATILPKIKSGFNADTEKFLEKYFAVWNLEKPTNRFASTKLKIEALWGLKYADKAYARFDSHGTNYDEAFLDSIKFNANESEFGKIWLPAITTNNALLRNLPTNAPIYGNPKKAGEGYPFDYASVSALSVAYPLLVSHFSKDGEWAFVQNDTVWGWIQSSNLQILDENSAEIYKNSNFLTILKDNAQIYDENNATIFLARSGTILPYESHNNAKFSGKFLSKMGYKRYFVNSSDASKFPAKLNNENLQILTNSLISQSYGWGGTSFLRDCSLMTKDFLANFGIWLPRNSKAQSNAGLKYELSEFSNTEKLEFIKTQGIAYRTILYLSGHIMLYVGEINGEVAVLHSVWGLRTIDDGRALIGKTALTTLEIGKNRPDIAKDRLLLSRISAMTILGE